MEISRVSAEELKRRLDGGEAVVVLDVRSAADYDNGHIAGARSLSVKELPHRYQEVPTDQTIVCY